MHKRANVAPSAARAENLLVLILEDNQDDATLMVHELEQTGFDPAWHCVETEAAYRDQLDQDWDVILADYTLPEFDALRALRLLKERERDIPFIVVTGAVSEETAVECMKRGASDYLLKDRLARLGPAVQHALEEKRVRDEKRQAEAALRQSEERFRSIFHQAGIGIAIERIEDGKIGQANQTLQEMLGYNVGELQEMAFADLVHPDDVGASRESFQKLRDEALDRCQIEGRYLHKAGQVVWGRTTITRIYDKAERPRLAVAMIEDITERKRAQEEGEAFVQELEARNAELERFTYTVSHDLKTPLVTIKGFLGMLQQDAAAGNIEQMNRDIQYISAAADKMRRLLGELLELSRVGRVVNPSEAVSLSVLAHEALNLVAGRVEQRGVTVEIDSEMPVVVADRVRLVEVFQNLIDNAVKFMGAQTAPHVKIGTRQDDETLVCYVQDNGMGIAPRYHEKIFGLFEQLNPHEGNTGIGLALVKRIVEMHGGRIWVESEESHGATFCFTLPMDMEPAGA